MASSTGPSRLGFHVQRQLRYTKKIGRPGAMPTATRQKPTRWTCSISWSESDQRWASWDRNGSAGEQGKLLSSRHACIAVLLSCYMLLLFHTEICFANCIKVGFFFSWNNPHVQDMPCWSSSPKFARLHDPNHGCCHANAANTTDDMLVRASIFHNC